MSLPKREEYYHQGMMDGIKEMMEFFIQYFYSGVTPDMLIDTSRELQLQFIAEERDKMEVEDAEFSYRLFALLVAKYGPPELQPPPKFKQFEAKKKAPKKKAQRGKPVKPKHSGH